MKFFCKLVYVCKSYDEKSSVTVLLMSDTGSGGSPTFVSMSL